eukprot:1959030-Rhodomonas_salina.5
MLVKVLAHMVPSAIAALEWLAVRRLRHCRGGADVDSGPGRALSLPPSSSRGVTASASWRDTEHGWRCKHPLKVVPDADACRIACTLAGKEGGT